MSLNEENEGVCKALTPQFKIPKAFYDPDPSVRNKWQLYRLFGACFAASSQHLRCLFAFSLANRSIMTFGRWWRGVDSQAHFVTGPIPVSVSIRKQPELALYSFKEFVDSGKEVRVTRT